MKIIPENIINPNRDIARKQGGGKGSQSSEAAARSSFDKITIESNQNQGMSDEQLISQLKKSILSDIQTGAPEYKLNDLKQQIALDEYDINLTETIRKIMFGNPEVPYE